MTKLTNEDLRERAEKLNETQELYEEMAFLYTDKMPCPECLGAGAVDGGSLSSICPRCFGQKAIAKPGAQQIQMPNFAEMRKRISAYGDALADRALPAGHRAKRGLDLPPEDSVPTMEELDELHRGALDTARQLQPGNVEELAKSLPTRAPTRLSDGTVLEQSVDADFEEDD